MRRAWDDNAGDWVRWARAPGHDSYWRFHGAPFLELLPPPGRLTVDIGCGGGRLGRDLLARGHTVIGIDGSPRMARACVTYPGSPQPAVAGDAARLPVRSACAELVVAFMSLQDIDDLESAVAETARILVPGGRLCLAIVHPLNSARTFEGDRDDRNAPFVIRGAYLDCFRYTDEIERDGLPMTFHSEHRPLEAYSRALERSGFVTEALRQVTVDDPDDRWSRLPLFLDLRARRG